ncbi:MULTISPECIES: 7-carboxy-7-deazaguanine synthase QueE [unclassified Planococcus (in: firmicutes)]|uniref:7-carboxy-7-deazaguanine synthase QueE n=1 Tax=unclassified Planococcus (in: firmicutes) TaxID=2662419 RepID=UPI000C329DDF|nr:MULTISPECIES: 7-carboxy-7-deazaguanine synthase QueE [unclassified Planococcus (in: firmicutes)]AUD13595.1 7-carboxy-7-deazaguanine synthase QueE [Planococcus sp. MB-3u-03]PKG46483.1 7-carboxy-7-deazaguanine synthase QueE [Planococcus sp. Urea-trap-24]PKG89419.1 7-carboxy-7-deazaguanine synthase QueE [Planococcus sp. Urea-3u-39]PKH41226.1 7-carboxy-7-deazaguanine synthase QueE [Planococcus sp. MB-3u-09]
MKIPVMEVFGPTIQGEGMVMGQKTMFVRTAGCDYSCSWCDSKFTWDGTGKSVMLTAEEIAEQLEELGKDAFSHVTISGGNPALHKGIAELVALCQENGWRTAVETQGSIWQDWLSEIDEVTVSPKPPSSGMILDYSKLDAMLGKLSSAQASLKVVVFDETDFFFAEQLHLRYPLFPFFLQVGNDDTQTTEDDKLVQHLLRRYQWLIDRHLVSAPLNDAKVLPQLHTLLWGNKRGV